MSRKDYRKLAAALQASHAMVDQSTLPAAQQEAHFAIAYMVATSIADVLAADNPRFDRARFLAAARHKEV